MSIFCQKLDIGVFNVQFIKLIIFELNQIKLFRSLFNGEELIDEILKIKEVKHYEQLRYLASKHDRSVLRIRFVW